MSWWHRIDLDDGLSLRCPTRADAAGVLAVHGDPAVYVHDPREVHPDLEHSQQFLEPVIKHWVEHGFGYWSVLVPRSWSPVGLPSVEGDCEDLVFAGLGGVQHRAEAGHRVLNVYFRIAPVVQGRGIAGRIVREAIRMAPEVAPACDIVVRTRPANAAARWVARRAGFADEGLEPGDPDMQILRLAAPKKDHLELHP